MTRLLHLISIWNSAYAEDKHHKPCLSSIQPVFNVLYFLLPCSCFWRVKACQPVHAVLWLNGYLHFLHLVDGFIQSTSHCIQTLHIFFFFSVNAFLDIPCQIHMMHFHHFLFLRQICVANILAKMFTNVSVIHRFNRTIFKAE